MTFDRHQQLVLGRCQAGRVRVILAPAQEAAQRHAELEKVFEILMRRLNETVLLRAEPEES
jgi:hypothetical protein